MYNNYACMSTSMIIMLCCTSYVYSYSIWLTKLLISLYRSYNRKNRLIDNACNWSLRGSCHTPFPSACHFSARRRAHIASYIIAIATSRAHFLLHDATLSWLVLYAMHFTLGVLVYRPAADCIVLMMHIANVWQLAKLWCGISRYRHQCINLFGSQ